VTVITPLATRLMVTPPVYGISASAGGPGWARCADPVHSEFAAAHPRWPGRRPASGTGPL